MFFLIPLSITFVVPLGLVVAGILSGRRLITFIGAAGFGGIVGGFVSVFSQLLIYGGHRSGGEDSWGVGGLAWVIYLLFVYLCGWLATWLVVLVTTFLIHLFRSPFNRTDWAKSLTKWYWRNDA